MSENVKNGFSWSASRNGTFESCRRQYFFHYYLAMGRAVDADSERRNEARRLRAMTSVPMWVGSRVHDAVEEIIREHARGNAINMDRELKKMRETMGRDWLDSKNDRARKQNDPRRYTRFMEHEYDADPPAEKWRNQVDDARQMVRFFGKHYLPEIQKLESSDIMALENLEKWNLEEVPIWVKIDFAYQDEEGFIHIVDWKTGRKDRGSNPLQMLGYAAYAADAWGADAEQLKVREVYLRREANPDSPCTLDEGTLDETRALIAASIKEMRSVLVDVDKNLAREEDFAPDATEFKCRYCFFQKICNEKWGNE